MNDETKYITCTILQTYVHDDTSLWIPLEQQKKNSDTKSNSYKLPEWLFAGQQDSRLVPLHTSTTCG